MNEMDHMTEMEKMDALRDRLHVTYAQAKEALDASEGDVTRALLYLEKQGEAFDEAEEQKSEQPCKQGKEETEKFVRGVIEQIKSIIQEGNATKIRLKNGDKVLFEVPATIGVVGIGLMLFSPLMLAITAFGTAAAVSREMVLEIQKSDGTVETRQLKWPTFGSGK